MTPAEPLHLLELGLFKYTIEGFCVALGYSPKSKSYPKIIKDLDNWARQIGRYLGHQSDRGLPRTYFPNGISGGTKLAGHEMNGVLLVLLKGEDCRFGIGIDIGNPLRPRCVE